jgi:serine/threonine protein kinase
VPIQHHLLLTQNMVGKGSFGVVWKANYLEQVVAVKVFISKDIDVNREVNTMAKVQSQPHVLDLIGK